MNALRSALHLLWMAVTVIPWATVVVLIAPFTSKERLYRICRAWLGLTMHAGRWILGIRNRVSGMQNLPAGAGDGAQQLLLHRACLHSRCGDHGQYVSHQTWRAIQRKKVRYHKMPLSIYPA